MVVCVQRLHAVPAMPRCTCPCARANLRRCVQTNSAEHETGVLFLTDANDRCASTHAACVRACETASAPAPASAEPRLAAHVRACVVTEKRTHEPATEQGVHGVCATGRRHDGHRRRAHPLSKRRAAPHPKPPSPSPQPSAPSPIPQTLLFVCPCQPHLYSPNLHPTTPNLNPVSFGRASLPVSLPPPFFPGTHPRSSNKGAQM